MFPQRDDANPRVACDAMCGGLARWLRALGVDASYTPDIADGDLVRHALAESRIVISSDGRLFERRVFSRNELRGLRLPVGLRLLDQVEFVVKSLGLHVRHPRCTVCNGELVPVDRTEVGDVVPALSLIWASAFFRCAACGHVFWEGSHWRRINSVRERFRALAQSTPSDRQTA